MTTMVEKVAQAIADNITAGLPDGVEIDARYAAFAAIEAMMEPTEAMKIAGFEAIEHQTSCSHYKDEGECRYCGKGFTKPDDCGFAAVAGFTAMIQAALKEQK